jgi:hypothetical protein
MRISSSLVIASLTCACAGFFSAGCIVETQAPPPGPPPGPVVVAEADAPLVQDPGVVEIDVEPPPDQRQYVYDPGYPPGTYFYGGYYYYGRYRYPHDVFVNRYVAGNVRDRRYANVDENRRAGAPIEAQHRANYARNGGHPQPAQQHGDDHHDQGR